MKQWIDSGRRERRDPVLDGWGQKKKRHQKSTKEDPVVPFTFLKGSLAALLPRSAVSLRGKGLGDAAAGIITPRSHGK